MLFSSWGCEQGFEQHVHVYAGSDQCTQLVFKVSVQVFLLKNP